MLRILGWPFRVAGGMISFMLGAVGRMLSLFLGMILATLGVVLSLTGIGLIVGVPLAMFGGALMLRSIF